MTDFKNRSRRLARQAYWDEHDRENYRCPDCDRPEDEIEGGFEVHHKNGEPMDNRPENQVALCRVCHCLREDKKPSLERIRSLRDGTQETSESQPPQSRGEAHKQFFEKNVQSVYLAGTMSYYNDEDSYWITPSQHSRNTRRFVEDADWREHIEGREWLEINSPKQVHFDHGADHVAGIVSTDMGLLEQSDAILAYFNKDEQVGTITELLYAIQCQKPALVLFDRKFFSGPLQIHDEASFKTFECPIHQRCGNHVYWFLINFLNGDGQPESDYGSWDGVASDVTTAIVDGDDGVVDAFWDWALTHPKLAARQWIDDWTEEAE